MPFERANITPAPSGFAASGPGFSTYDGLGDGDDPKTTYITPVMNGFQAGISFMKDVGKSANDIASQTSTSTSGENWYTVGLKYSGKMGKSAIGVGVGYGSVEIPSLGDTKSMIMAGGNVETGPWKVGLAMMTLDDPSIDWVSMAWAHGVEAVSADTVQAFEEALTDALAHPGPCLIEARI